MPSDRPDDSKIFTTLDLKKAYFQISVTFENVSKAVVTTPFCLFKFVGIPLGLRNAIQTFQRFGGLQGHDLCSAIR